MDNHIYCKSCNYDIIAIADGKCPECGSNYILDDTSTYNLKPKHLHVSKHIKYSTITAAIIIVVLLAIWLIMPYLNDWRSKISFSGKVEQLAIGMSRQEAITIMGQPLHEIPIGDNSLIGWTYLHCGVNLQKRGDAYAEINKEGVIILIHYGDTTIKKQEN